MLEALQLSAHILFQVFLTLPCLLFIVQIAHKTLSRVQSRSLITDSEALPGGVTRISFPKPRGMQACMAGQYVEITIHAISFVEVHPFSLSGCPKDGNLQLHIKVLGDWTRKLHELASQDKLNGTSVHVMGPFATRAYQVQRYQDILLIGAGIGATPFISILESILKNNQSQKKRVHFHWLVNNQQAAQSWFPGLLQGIEDYSGDQQIAATVWYTSARAFNSPIQKHIFEFSEKLFWDKLGRDMVTGIHKRNHQVKIHFGRPKWGTLLLDHIGTADPEPIGVFCCGPASLSDSLSRACMEQSTTKIPINFHSEHFNAW